MNFNPRTPEETLALIEAGEKIRWGSLYFIFLIFLIPGFIFLLSGVIFLSALFLSAFTFGKVGTILCLVSAIILRKIPEKLVDIIIIGIEFRLEEKLRIPIRLESLKKLDHLLLSMLKGPPRPPRPRRRKRRLPPKGGDLTVAAHFFSYLFKNYKVRK